MLSTLEFVLSAGFLVTVACPSAGALADHLRHIGIRQVPFDMRSSEGVRYPQDECRRRLHEILVEQEPDLVHANSLSAARLSGPVVTGLGLRSIGHLRDIVGLSRRAVDDLNEHTRMLAVSGATRRYHLEQGIDENRTFVLHNGVQPRTFSTPAMTEDGCESSLACTTRRDWPSRSGRSAYAKGTTS